MMTPAELIRWAIREIRDLDELCRGQVPGYGSLESDDMDNLTRLNNVANELEGTTDAS